MILLMQTPEHLLAIRFVARILARGAWVEVGTASGTHEVCPEFLNCVCEMRHTGTATSVSPSPQCYSKQVRGERGQSQAAGLPFFFFPSPAVRGRFLVSGSKKEGRKEPLSNLPGGYLGLH